MKKQGLYEKLIEYSRDGRYPFHMPGHKRIGHLFECNNVSTSDGEKHLDPYDIDLTEIEGFDNLHGAQGIIKEAQHYASNFLGAKKTWFLVNGSTCGLHSAINAVCDIGDTIIVARNCHKAVFHAIENRNLNGVYYTPKFDEKLKMFGAVEPEVIAKLLEANPDAKALVITSPTYDGVVSNIEAISHITKKHGCVLIVDEAHGAHFGVSDCMPIPAYKKGADIVVESAHKTLEAMTQTGLLHLGSDAVSPKKIEQQLAIYETSSPSYVLMASIDKSINIAEQQGDKKLRELLTRIQKFRDFVNNLDCFYVPYDELKTNLQADSIDETKVSVCVAKNVITGEQLSEMLREHGIEVEMATSNRVLLYCTMGDDLKAFNLAEEALASIDQKIADYNPANEDYVKINNVGTLESKMTIYAASRCDKKQISVEDALGQVAADYVFLYPPGNPLIVPGEVINQELISVIEESLRLGLNIYNVDNGIINVVDE